ncbi:MAG: sigma 54-interacting transcriptional regulator [Deltaproteobacteria bacterium]|nr:sigma 54-interacting transcriptional regulator [Deltaproteobacteria bacterium]
MGSALPGLDESTADELSMKRAQRRTSLDLVLAFECHRPLAEPLAMGLAGVERVVIGRAKSRVSELVEREGVRSLRVGVPDRWMSAEHVQLTRVLGGWVVEDLESKNGVVLDGRPVQKQELREGALLEVGHTFFTLRKGGPQASKGRARELIPTQHAGFGSDLDRLDRVAPSLVPVVILGESGTGKELLAQVTHRLSGRKGPFLALNCAALPKTLVESELFGHKRGAFSGADTDRTGLVVASSGGSLFLDEIGDLPLEAQASLLRVLQEREVMPLGSTRAVKVDLRLIVATHRDLEALERAGQFRADLLARLAGFTLRSPPLRERREDLGPLIARLLERHFEGRAQELTFSSEAARAIFRHAWPLNVRELERALMTAGVLAEDGEISLEALPLSVRQPAPKVEAQTLSDREKQRLSKLQALLKEHRGNVTAVADALGKSRMQVHRWLKRYGIEPEDFRG